MRHSKSILLLISLSLIGVFTLYLALVPVDGCIRTFCGPIVSKCQLLGSCRCEAKLNATCFKECSYCLKNYYDECCSCVEICPSAPENDTDADSHVEIIEEANPELFELLNSEQDSLARWTTFHEPVQTPPKTTSTAPNTTHTSSTVHINQTNRTVLSSEDKQTKPSHKNHSDQSVSVSNGPLLAILESATTQRPDEAKLTTASTTNETNNTQPIQCTVAYLASCMEIFKCQKACTTLGASAFRWFDDGCCECVGQYCLNFGINEARCRSCPDENVTEEQEL